MHFLPDALPIFSGRASLPSRVESCAAVPSFIGVGAENFSAAVIFLIKVCKCAQDQGNGAAGQAPLPMERKESVCNDENAILPANGYLP
jgi:hypothetical protein